MLNHLLKIRNCKLKIVFFALILFLLMAKNVDASIINKSPNYLGSSNGLVGYWTMDGSKVNWNTGAVTDSSGRGNTGTITNMATSTGVAIGKIGQALNFDGVNDFVTISNATVAGTFPFSMSLWFKTSNTTDSYRTIYGDGNTTDDNEFMVLQLVASNDTQCTGTVIHKLKYVLRSDASTVTASCSTNTVNNNAWHHAVIVSSSSNNHQLYLDGTAMTASITALGTISVNRTTIGALGRTSVIQFFPGLIDEVRVYNRALSAKEIQTLYNIGATTKFNVSPTKYLTDGLVGYWTMDGSKVNWKTGAVTDSSGRGNTGTITNMATSTGVAIGKIGQALNFDGVNDYVDAGDIAAVDTATTLSGCAWVYHNTLTADNAIISKINTIDGWILFRDDVAAVSERTDTYTIFLADSVDTNEQRIESATNASKATTWTHVCFTFKAADSSGLRLYVNGTEDANSPVSTASIGAINADVATFRIGSRSSNGALPLNGLIDEVRVYNRALSAKEIQTLYNIGATTKFNVSPTKYLTDGLVGYWTMDGSKVNWKTGAVTDSSGRGNTGTITNMATSTGVGAGKIGQALEFDGRDDYVNAGDNTSLRITGSFTISAWVKTNQNTTGLYVATKYNNTNGYFLGITGTAPAGRMFGGVTTAGTITRRFTNTVLTKGQWYHIVTTYSTAGTENMYVNSVLDNGTQEGTPPTSVPSTSGINFEVGSNNGGASKWNGLIDEVRVYNRALSADEIQKLYNAGR